MGQKKESENIKEKEVLFSTALLAVSTEVQPSASDISSPAAWILLLLPYLKKKSQETHLKDFRYEKGEVKTSIRTKEETSIHSESLGLRHPSSSLG